MTVKAKWLAMLCAPAALCLLLLPGMAKHAGAPAQAQPAHTNAVHTGTSVSTLFPGLSEHAITSLTITTPDRSFHFLCEDPQHISVNGQQADGEIFWTLFEQIAELPVDVRGAFAPDAGQLLLTLVVSSGGHQQTARFYADGKHGEKVHIVAGSPDAPEYRQTGGWRVGTLMLTCEGTRIQDAHGNEMPAGPS